MDEETPKDPINEREQIEFFPHDDELSEDGEDVFDEAENDLQQQQQQETGFQRGIFNGFMIDFKAYTSQIRTHSTSRVRFSLNTLSWSWTCTLAYLSFAALGMLLPALGLALPHSPLVATSTSSSSNTTYHPQYSLLFLLLGIASFGGIRAGLSLLRTNQQSFSTPALLASAFGALAMCSALTLRTSVKLWYILGWSLQGLLVGAIESLLSATLLTEHGGQVGSFFPFAAILHSAGGALLGFLTIPFYAISLQAYRSAPHLLLCVTVTLMACGWGWLASRPAHLQQAESGSFYFYSSLEDEEEEEENAGEEERKGHTGVEEEENEEEEDSANLFVAASSPTNEPSSSFTRKQRKPKPLIPAFSESPYTAQDNFTSSSPSSSLSSSSGRFFPNLQHSWQDERTVNQVRILLLLTLLAFSIASISFVLLLPSAVSPVFSESDPDSLAPLLTLFFCSGLGLGKYLYARHLFEAHPVALLVIASILAPSALFLLSFSPSSPLLFAAASFFFGTLTAPIPLAVADLYSLASSLPFPVCCLSLFRKRHPWLQELAAQFSAPTTALCLVHLVLGISFGLSWVMLLEEERGSPRTIWSSILLFATLTTACSFALFLLSLDKTKNKKKRKREQEMRELKREFLAEKEQLKVLKQRQSQQSQLDGYNASTHTVSYFEEQEEKEDRARGGLLGNLMEDVTTEYFPRAFHEV